MIGGRGRVRWEMKLEGGKVQTMESLMFHAKYNGLASGGNWDPLEVPMAFF